MFGDTFKSEKQYTNTIRKKIWLAVSSATVVTELPAIFSVNPQDQSDSKCGFKKMYRYFYFGNFPPTPLYSVSPSQKSFSLKCPPIYPCQKLTN